MKRHMRWRNQLEIFFFPIYLSHVYECMLSCFSPVLLFVTLWALARQDPLSMGFSRQEYWSGLSCPPPGDLANPKIKPTTFAAPALQADSLLLRPWRSPNQALGCMIMNRAGGGDGTPAKLFKILKADAIKVLHLLCW